MGEESGRERAGVRETFRRRVLEGWQLSAYKPKLHYREKSTGTDSVLKGPKSAVSVSVNLPLRFFGTCHRAEQVKPQPYSNFPEAMSRPLLSRIS